jgi:hypothetical protein
MALSRGVGGASWDPERGFQKHHPDKLRQSEAILTQHNLLRVLITEHDELDITRNQNPNSVHDWLLAPMRLP